MSALRAHQDLLAQVPRDRAKPILFHAFQELVLTTKHPGFGEEEELRIIHSPFMFSSAYVMPSIHTIGGIPQVVHKIKLKKQPKIGREHGGTPVTNVHLVCRLLLEKNNRQT